MKAVLYCSKINLISQELYQAYQNEDVLPKVLATLLGDLSPDVVYEEINKFDNENGEIVVSTINYKLSISEKTSDYVYGHLCKDSTLYYKTFNEKTKMSETKSTPYTESVQFYFDVFNELIVFHTASRLGYREFNNAIEGIINKTLEENNRDFRFSVSLRTEGMEIQEIEEELKRINNIYELRFRFQPPNPDSDTLNRIRENGERLLDTMEDANVTRISHVFETKGGRGLNIDSELIKENIDNIKNMSSVTGEKNAVGKGYIVVEAVDAHGKKYTTDEEKPFKVEVKSLDHFIRDCKRLISGIL